MIQDKIEILSVGLLDRCRSQVNSLKELACSLNLEFGWHYLLDQSWILSQFDMFKGKHILDAGAGTGVIQWYLAQQGAQVISVDRMNRASLPPHFRNRFRVRGLRPQDLNSPAQAMIDHISKQRSFSAKTKTFSKDLMGTFDPRRSSGEVILYNQDLKNLVDIASNSLDAVVAVSSLEHNSQEDLDSAIHELLRVLKPGGVILASLNAARDQDWWHSPSDGWCLTEASIKRIFNMASDVLSNYDQYDRLFMELIECTELRENLASFYACSGKNGMPWGKWDPQYQPVGVCKVKSSELNR